MTISNKSILALLLTICAGCGSDGLSGEYRDPRGVTGYEFDGNGRVFISVMGSSTTARYTLEGDRVLIDGPAGIVVLRRVGDELAGPLGIKLTRNPRAGVSDEAPLDGRH